MGPERGRDSAGFRGGHGVFYMIPGSENSAELGKRRVNWAIYAPQPDGLDFSDPSSIPPGSVNADLYGVLDRILDESFPPMFQELVRLNTRDEVSIQPIYHQAVARYVNKRVAIIGDAATITRPHTGSGATKALQDALTLEQACDELDDWDAVLDRYNTDRVAVGNSTVELGRRIGHAQVENTPEWAEMSEDDFGAWAKATLSGEKHYFYELEDE